VPTWPSLSLIDIPIPPHTIDDISFFSACSDNIRLWNAAEAGEGETRGRMQFKIIPGHHGGLVSQMCEFMTALGRCVHCLIIHHPSGRPMRSVPCECEWQQRMARGGHENGFCARHQADCMSGFVANSISVFPCAAFSLSNVDSRRRLGKEGLSRCFYI
jgi:hypothetical protein